jgi:glutamate carboxypeptidase
MLSNYFTARRGELLDLLADLVAADSPSADKARCDAHADTLAQRFAPLAQVTRSANPDGGDHLIIRYAPPATANQPPALLLCHYDTVWPAGTAAARPLRIEGNQAFGPGAYDMKINIILVEYALRAVRDLGLNLPRPITLLITSDEEIGSPTSRALIEEHARTAAFTLVLEPPVEPHRALKTARKGGGMFSVELLGRAAHAGVEPEKGISAVNEMARQILAINRLADPSQGTTINVGVAQGGTRPNVVPARAGLEIDARAWTAAEAERVETALFKLQPEDPGVSITVSGGMRRPPMERTERTAELFARVRAIGAELGLDLQEGSTGGGSDGNFSAAVGSPTLDGLGSPGAGAHADHEHIEIDGMIERGALLTALISRLS